MKLKLILLATLMHLLSGCAMRHGNWDSRLTGPQVDAIPLFRNQRTPDKLYVIATLPDGKDRAFLVDTGSSLTTVSEKVAKALDLEVRQRAGRLVGLGGSSVWNAAVVDHIKIGQYTTRKVQVAVGVTGLPARVGLVPLAGIIGNNIWSEFQMAIDYPANQLTLAREGLQVPQSAQPMFFNGQHPIARAQITAKGAAPQQVLLEIDTGARGLLLMGTPPPGIASHATVGEEPIIGIGSADDLPPSQFLRQTRRIPLAAIRAGGLNIERPIAATWLRPHPSMRGKASRFSGLLGHEVLEGHVVHLDYQNRQFAMTPSTTTPQPRPLHEWYLGQLKRERPDDWRMQRIRTLLWLNQGDEARQALHKLASKKKPDAAAVVLLARLQRKGGDPSAAHKLLGRLEVADLVAQGELNAWVNTLCLTGRGVEALQATRHAVSLWPDDAQAWVSHADALRQEGHYGEARTALHRANQIQENPDGHLLRRAWLAVEDGDKHAAMTHFRRLLDLFPAGGVVHLLYALQADDKRSLELVRQDLARAESRLHKGDGPLDFMSAAWRILGDKQRANALMEAGLARDCSRARTSHSKDNCEAWYQALAHHELDDARSRIDRALQRAPSRAEFLDTLAMVLEAQGHNAAAGEAAIKAAIMAPDDIYLLVQAARLAQTDSPD